MQAVVDQLSNFPIKCFFFYTVYRYSVSCTTDFYTVIILLNFENCTLPGIELIFLLFVRYQSLYLFFIVRWYNTLPKGYYVISSWCCYNSYEISVILGSHAGRIKLEDATKLSSLTWPATPRLPYTPYHCQLIGLSKAVNSHQVW